MTNDLVRRADLPIDKDELERISRIANNLGKSGMFPDAKDGYAAFAKIILGRSLGLGPSQAMTGLHVVKGNVQIAATTLGSFVQQSEYGYRIIVHDDERCILEFGYGKPPAWETPPTVVVSDEGEPEITDGVLAPWPQHIGFSVFTMQDAEKAKLAVKQADGTYKAAEKASEGWGKYPRNMLFARAMSNGVRWYCADLFGGVPVYTEADAFRPDIGEGLTTGTGDGGPRGIDLGPDVEAVIQRAEDLGHAALSNRAAIEVQLDGRGEVAVRSWLTTAGEDLDRMEGQITDATVTGDGDPQELHDEAVGKLAEWEAMVAAGNGETPEAFNLKAEADTLAQKAASAAEKQGVAAEVRRVEGDVPEDGETDGE